MTATQVEATEAVWSLDAIDPMTKLFLLALVATGDPDAAAQRAGMPAGQTRLTLEWLRERGIIDDAGRVDATALAQLAPDQPTG